MGVCGRVWGHREDMVVTSLFCYVLLQMKMNHNIEINDTDHNRAEHRSTKEYKYAACFKKNNNNNKRATQLFKMHTYPTIRVLPKAAR